MITDAPQICHNFHIGCVSLSSPTIVILYVQQEQQQEPEQEEEEQQEKGVKFLWKERME